jgi:putative endonuclease
LTQERLKFGREGESAALRFLKKKGYRILEKNFRSKVGEIDIIAEQDGVIVFVEVKARADHEFGHPLNALTPAKQKKIIQTAQSFLSRKRISDKPMRFDVVALTSDAEGPDSWQIELLQNAFQV